MKKYYLIPILAMMILFQATFSFAAWTTTAIVESDSPIGSSIIKFTFVGDGTALSTDLFTIIAAQTGSMNIHSAFAGKYIYRGLTIPGTGAAEPSSTYTITLTDKLQDVATLTDRSTTATESTILSSVSQSGGFLSTYSSVLITVEDIGSGNSFDLYLEVVR